MKNECLLGMLLSSLLIIGINGKSISSFAQSCPPDRPILCNQFDCTATLDECNSLSSSGNSGVISSSDIKTEFENLNAALKTFSKSSKATRSFTKIFSKSINAVNNDLKASDCQDSVTADLDQLGSIFTDVHQKACTNPSKRLLLKTSTKYLAALRMKNCIPGQAISDFNNAVDKFNTDITSALPDICGSN